MYGSIIIVGTLFFMMILALVGALGFVFTDLFFDEIAPVIDDLGVVSYGTTEANLTEYAGYGFDPVNSMVQNLNWIVGIVYAFLLLATIGIAVVMRYYPNKFLMGFYILLMLLLVVGAILMSNVYEGFYNGTDEFAVRLQEATLLSFLILHSPMIMAIIGFIAGAVMFSGLKEEDYQ